MKTLITTLFISLFVFSLTAQTNINSKYLIEVKKESTSAKISKFQNMAAQYNIQEENVFNSKDKSTYNVVFEETNCKIEATYNTEGEIVSSKETYTNMRLPYELASIVQKEYPKWQVLSTIQNLKYTNSKKLSGTYKIVIQNGNETKNLKFKLNNQDSVKNYIAYTNR